MLTLRRYFPYFLPRSLVWRLGFYVLAGTLLGVLLPWPLKTIIDEASKGSATLGSPHVLGIALLAFVFLSVLRGWLYLKRHTSAARLSENFGRLLSRDLIGRFLNANTVAQKTDLSIRLNQDVEQLKDAFTEISESLVVEFLTFVGALIVMVNVDFGLSLVLLASLAPNFICLSLFSDLFLDSHQRLRELDSRRFSSLDQLVEHRAIIKLFQKETFEVRKHSRLLRQRAKQRSALAKKEGRYYAYSESLSALSIGIVIAYGGWQVFHARLTMGEVVLALQYTILLLGPISHLSQLSSLFQRTRANLQRLDSVLAIPKADTKITTKVPHFQSLQFRKVAMAYDPAHPILEDVNLTLRAGESIAIVGPSGAGKTTFLNCVMGFLSPKAGQIFLNEDTLAPLTSAAWRKQIAYVPQNPDLFPRTVAENLYYATPHCQPKAHAFPFAEMLNRFPEGTATQLAQTDLSAGEKQRLSIQRALIKNAPILIMDEPTSALDTESENDFIQAIQFRQRENAGLTLFVTHRPSLLQLADRVWEVRGQSIHERPHKNQATPSNMHYN